MTTGLLSTNSRFTTITAFASAILALLFAAIALLDGRMQRASLLGSLEREALAQNQAFTVAMTSLEQQMLVLATTIAHDQRTQALFRDGKRAVEAEGGGIGGAEAARLRAALYAHLAPTWHHLQQRFGVRQLQFHLGPGSLSFLRVHAPDHAGDRMDGLRHIIEDVNRDQVARSGLETGRIYSGVRGVVPVWFEPPDGEREYLGALEAGTSFDAQLDWLAHQTDTGFAILFDREHIETSVWEAYRSASGATAHFLEAASPAVTPQWLDTALTAANADGMARVVAWEGRSYHLTRFALRDYLGLRDAEREPIGEVLMWHDVSAVLAQRNTQQQTRLTTILLAYVFAQGMLMWLRRRLQRHVDDAVAAEKAAQQDVMRWARRHEQLLLAAGEGIYGMDSQGRAMFINPAALSMLGLTVDEVIGIDQHQLFHHHRPDGRPYPHQDCPIYQTLADGRIRRIEDEWFWRKDGSGFPVTLTVTPTEKDGQRNGAVVVFQDMTERKQREAELQRLATTDTLTGLANRRCLIEHIEQELARFQRSGTPAALLMLDLDRFKRVNDRYGHAIGDAVLQHFAHIMQSRVRRIDFVGRLGGEEFVIVLADTPADGARSFAEQLCASVAEQALPCDDGPLHYTVSIGVAHFEPSDSSSDTLLARADAALYRAKANGRNRVEVQQGNAPNGSPATAMAAPNDVADQ